MVKAKSPAKKPVKKKLTQEQNRNWPLLMGLGIIFVLFGCLGLSMVVGVTLVSILFIGLLFMVSGIIQFVDVFRSREWNVAVWHGFVALFYLIGGGLIIYDPLLASTIITALIAWTLILIGVVRLVMAIKLHNAVGAIWLALASIAAIALGGIILMQWPVSSLWIIGLFVSIELLVTGFSYIFTAFSMNRKLR